jgi:hypothetical protein
MQEQGSLPLVNAGICLTAEFNEMRGSWRGSGVSQTWKLRYAYKHDSPLKREILYFHAEGIFYRSISSLTGRL